MRQRPPTSSSITPATRLQAANHRWREHFSAKRVGGVRTQWDSAQAEFVDHYRECVQKADRLVSDVFDQLTAGLRKRADAWKSSGRAATMPQPKTCGWPRRTTASFASGCKRSSGTRLRLSEAENAGSAVDSTSGCTRRTPGRQLGAAAHRDRFGAPHTPLTGIGKHVGPTLSARLAPN
jgi:hypothetical protein